jgi:hypothetical protein
MKLLPNVIEIGVIAYSLLFYSRIIRRRLFRIIVIGSFAFATVTSGEIINNFVSRGAIYNPSFLIWVPFTEIPVFILMGGPLLSIIIFLLGQIIGRGWNKFLGRYGTIAATFLCTFAFPLLDYVCVRLGLWHYTFDYGGLDGNWFVGVWKFYLLFIGLPAMTGAAARLFSENTEARTSMTAAM